MSKSRPAISKRDVRAQQNSAIGTSPVSITVPLDATETAATVHIYSATGHRREKLTSGLPRRSKGELLWIDIHGLQNKDFIVGLARSLGLTDLAIAEIFDTDQRPNTEVESDIVEVVLRMPAGGPPFEADQFSLFLGADFLLTIREHERNCLDPVRKRLEAGSRRIRSSSGYLLYALIDAVIDTYFPMMERYGTLTDVLEGQVLTNADESVLRDIHVLKRELLDLRHTLWPLREAMAALQRDNTPHIEDGVLPFLRDCSDHAFQLVDIVEVYRETAQGLVDLHLSSLSNRMNEIMKVLTIIATIFIPMTFITGLYGMNFDRSSPWNMPELGWKYGYEYLLGLLLVIFVVMLVGFWRQGWILQGLRKPRRGPLAGRGAGPRDHHGGSGDVKRN